MSTALPAPVMKRAVPPELVFGHPNFLWPCLGMAPKRGNWLRIYAADLARAPDGHWWVMADRTQTPSGAGYALENREILEQVSPDLLSELHTRPIGSFFGELRRELLDGIETGESPLAVILTPGPFNETYFERQKRLEEDVLKAQRDVEQARSGK